MGILKFIYSFTYAWMVICSFWLLQIKVPIKFCWRNHRFFKSWAYTSYMTKPLYRRKECEYLHEHLYINVHDRSIHVAQNWKLLKCPSTVELINILWYVHTTDYYSIIGKLIHSTTWMNCRIIRWGESVQTQKTTHCMISPPRNSRKGKLIYHGGQQISNDGRNRRMYCKGARRNLGIVEMLFILDVAVASQVCASITAYPGTPLHGCILLSSYLWFLMVRQNHIIITGIFNC